MSDVVTGRRDAFLGVITVEVVMEAITSARRGAAAGAADAPVGTNTGSVEGLGQESVVAPGADGGSAS